MRIWHMGMPWGNARPNATATEASVLAMRIAVVGIARAVPAGRVPKTAPRAGRMGTAAAESVQAQPIRAQRIASHWMSPRPAVPNTTAARAATATSTIASATTNCRARPPARLARPTTTAASQACTDVTRRPASCHSRLTFKAARPARLSRVQIGGSHSTGRRSGNA